MVNLTEHSATVTHEFLWVMSVRVSGFLSDTVQTECTFGVVQSVPGHLAVLSPIIQFSLP